MGGRLFPGEHGDGGSLKSLSGRVRKSDAVSLKYRVAYFPNKFGPTGDLRESTTSLALIDRMDQSRRRHE
ncbi:MAG: hypothetical protein JWR17_4788 [Pseudomonas sp.]|nr:hypothetical protein [Pseudomonas sp.]